MAGELRLLVITPERVIFDKPIASATLPGTEGSFGVLKNHAPLIAAVEPGELIVVEPDGARYSFFIADGFVEIKDNMVRLVVDSGEPVKEIDIKRAEDAEKRARERVAGGMKVDVDLPHAEAALRRAIMRTKLRKKYQI
ncbi:MAG: ATP synthase F1 subunit epsilon [Planctomycetes bacterium]|nr:ATP synthase F1 subunit epsilon [Planctomycetota bacterium]